VSSPVAARRPLRLAVLVCALALGGCGPESTAPEAPPEPEAEGSEVVATLVFDEHCYVDAALPVPKLVERLRRQTQSILLALQRAGVSVSHRKQVEIDPSGIKKEPVTVVDPATGITRAALRVRYHFQSLAIAPRALAQKGPLALGVLHGVDDARALKIRAECTAAAPATVPLWNAFDASLDSCARAIAREQTAVDATRRNLHNPASEISSAEFERLYFPVKVHLGVKRSRPPRPPSAAVPGANLPTADAGILVVRRQRGLKTPDGLYVPQDSDQPIPLILVDDDREDELEEAEEKENTDPDDVAHRPLKRPTLVGEEPARVADYSSGGKRSPVNYTLLYVAVAAVIALLVGKRQHDKYK
jgi:hypothetical protein